MSITGRKVGGRLKDCPVVVALHELSPAGRQATGRRDGRWFERFAERGLTTVASAGGATA
jgi:hypothetical protein